MAHLLTSFRRLSVTPNKSETTVVPCTPATASRRDLKIQYNNYVTEARNIEKSHQNLYDDYDNLEKCYNLYLAAHEIFDRDDKLKKKLAKLKSVLDEYEDVGSEEEKDTIYISSNNQENRNPNIQMIPQQIRARKSLAPTAKPQTTEVSRAAPVKDTTHNKSRAENNNNSKQPIIVNTNQSAPTVPVLPYVVQPDGFVYDSKNNSYRLPDPCKPLPSNHQQITEQLLPYNLSSDIYKELYGYQRDSIKWFWRKHCEAKNSRNKVNSGGILGDDMGLGKTVQVVAYLDGLFESELVEHIMIGMPVSVLQNWRKEFTKWAPQIPLYMFHNLSKSQRETTLEQFAESGGVLLTTYGMVTSQNDLLVKSFKKHGYCFDYIFLDEGHKVKNPTIQLSLSLRKIPVTYCKFILTGTPVQNNLMEMWALFDYLFNGRLLGSSRTFKIEFEKKIVRAGEKDASDYEKRLGNQMSMKLRSIIEPHFLRREKSVVLTATSSVSISRKNDLIVWIRNSDRQIELYSDFLTSSEVRAVLNQSQSALAALTILKQICSHPNLLVANKKKVNKVPDMVQQSGKLKFLDILLKQLFAEKHRVLIFSQSIQMLYIISKLLDSYCYSYLQIDGTISDSRQRQKLIDEFNAPNSKHFCFLLTSQVGGFGITLTSADRVIIFDPSWNPAVDSQAVDRAYRIGQTKDVIVYRLITCGTIEEKIYRKQVFKGSLSKQTIEKSNQYRYFTHSELRELFTMGNTEHSETQQQLREIHQQASHYPEMKLHVDRLQRLASSVMAGYSDHDALFSKTAEDVVHADQKSIEEAERSYQRLFSQSGSNESVNATPIRKNAPKTAPTPRTKSKFTGNELSLLLKGIRMYGEQGKWGLINLEFFPEFNFSSSVLEKAWLNFKQDKTKKELEHLISQFDDEFDVLPPFPKITGGVTETARVSIVDTSSPGGSQDDAISLDDEDDDLPEPIESVCRRVSMGLGLLGPPPDEQEDEEDEEEENCDYVCDSPRSQNSETGTDDSFLVYDNDVMSDGEADYQTDGNNESDDEDQIEFVDNDDDMEMRERTVSTRKLRKNIVLSDDEDEDMGCAEEFEIRPFNQRLSETSPAVSPSTAIASKDVHLSDDLDDALPTCGEEEDSSSIGICADDQQQLSETYVQLILQARQYEVNNQLPEALAFYMLALDESDQDNKLHCKICCLARRLGFRQ